jgi:hypothetical protein
VSMRPKYAPRMEIKEVWTNITRLGHVPVKVDDMPAKIECGRCGIDVLAIARAVHREGRLIAGVIPRCPGHRPLNYFVYRRPTVREMLDQLTKARTRE